MELLKKIQKNKLLKNSLLLINGTIISQAINILISPILSRVYSPSDFGAFSNINAIVLICIVIANGKYDLAIMNSTDDEKKCKATYYLAMFITILFCSMIIILGMVLKIINIDIFSYLEIISIAIMIFFGSNNSIINIWLNRNRLYKHITRNRIIYSVVYALLSITLGSIGMGYKGFLYATITAYAVQFIYVYIMLFKKTNFFKYKMDAKLIKLQLIRYKDYPRYQMPALLLNSSSTQIPIMLFNSFWGSDVSGWYAMTVKIISLPLTIVGNAIGDIFFKEASEIYAAGDKEHLKRFTYKTFKTLLFIGIIPMSIILIYGDILFKIILGQEWYMAGIYAMVLSPWYFMVFVTSPFTNLFPILEKQKSNLFLNVIMLLSRILAIVIGFLIFKEVSIYTVVLFGIVGFLMWIYTNGYVLKLVNISYKKSIIITLGIFISFSLIIALPRLIFYMI